MHQAYLENLSFILVPREIFRFVGTSLCSDKKLTPGPAGNSHAFWVYFCDVMYYFP